MSAHNVIAFHEAFHGKLPVGGEDGAVPPCHLQLVGIALCHSLYDRAQRLYQSGCIVVEVDEGTACPGFKATGDEIQFRLVERSLAEDLLAEDEGVLPVGVPAPAVERAYKALRLAIA